MGRDGHLEETLRRIVAEALATQVQDPRVGFVTVSEVRLNRDRTVAEVFYTVLGDEEERATTLRGLKKVRGFIRQIIGANTRMRAVPELRFTYDESLDRSFRVEALLNEISDRDGSDAPDADAGGDSTDAGAGEE